MIMNQFGVFEYSEKLEIGESSYCSTKKYAQKFLFVLLLHFFPTESFLENNRMNEFVVCVQHRILEFALS